MAYILEINESTIRTKTNPKPFSITNVFNIQIDEGNTIIG